MNTELNMNETVDTSVVDAVDNEKTESYQEFLSRRGHTMAGMIGLASSTLSHIGISAAAALDYYDTVKLLKTAVRDMGIAAIKAQIQLEQDWIDMNSVNDTNYLGNKFGKAKIDKLTTELKALETLVF